MVTRHRASPALLVRRAGPSCWTDRGHPSWPRGNATPVRAGPPALAWSTSSRVRSRDPRRATSLAL